MRFKMDNLTFIFDTVMLKDENNDYYAINLNYDLWKNRYLKSFSSIIVSTRVKNVSNSEINQKKGYTISNNVKMMPITEYNKVTDIILHKKKILRQLQEVINSADNIIIRLPSPLGNLACNVCRKQNKKYAIE